jgi:hypothetical protein
MSNAQWNDDQSAGERALRKHARLVEAAPLMLAALEEVSEWCHQGHGSFPATHCGLCKPIFKAIEAAKGIQRDRED